MALSSEGEEYANKTSPTLNHFMDAKSILTVSIHIEINTSNFFLTRADELNKFN